MTEKNDKAQSAVALAYDGEHAPQIVAKGHGELAADILQAAKEHGVLVHEDEELVKVLQRIELGDSIPKELFVIIAELIAFSYVLQGKFPDEWHNIHQRIDLKS
ncbi:EscU/YscU/HrcU family type III secretion system export apparatus switch protein [Rheinheimera sp.]|uniref:EscU/YscU/HrcU family type III secretion system export apparatus switch protein n=1 Tax=Rheinheimera sp. TaxID=1869214 RepID=UPI00307CD274